MVLEIEGVNFNFSVSFFSFVRGMYTPLHRVPFDVLHGIFVDFDSVFFWGGGGGGIVCLCL